MKSWILIFTVLVFPKITSAVNLPQNFNFDGVLLDNTNAPILSPTLTLDITDPSGGCLLYEETQNAVAVDAVTGAFSIKIGSGTRNASADGGGSFKTIFQNDSSVRIAGTNCSIGYTPAAGDGRRLRVTVNGTVLTPDYNLSPVPMATVAESLQGKAATDFVAATSATSAMGPITMTSQGEIRFNDASANYISFKAPVAITTSATYTWPSAIGTSGQFLTTNGAQQLSWANPSSSGISSLNGLTTNAQTFAVGGSGSAPGFSSTGSVHTLNLPTASVSASGILSATDWSTFNSKASALGYTPVNKTGDTMTGALNMGTNKISNLVAPTASSDAANKSYVDTATANFLPLNGGTVTGPIVIGTPAQGSATAPTFNSSGSGIYFPASGVSVATAGVDRLTVTPSGNIGVGNISPSHTLDVAGSLSGYTLTVGTTPPPTPVTLIRNYVATASFSSISAGATGTFVASVPSVATTDIAILHCTPATTPTGAILHSCYVSGPSSVTIVVLNASGAAITPPSSWNISQIKF